MRADESVSRFSLLEPGDRVLCALSGGADSVCLTHFLAENAGRLGIAVAAAHFSHGLRPKDAEEEKALCQRLCAELSIPLFWEAGDTAAFAKARRVGLEEAARILRRRFLEQTAQDWGADKIATGHHLEDSAETLLLNLIRGTGGAGLAGIPPKAGRWIRPLILSSRQEIQDYLTRRAIPWADDPTNLAGDNARAVLRRQVFPILIQMNGQALPHLARTALDQWQAGQPAAGEGAAFAAEARREAGERQLSIPALLALEPESAVRALQQLQREAGGRMLERSHIRALLALCQSPGPSGQVSLPGSRGVRRGDRLILTARPPDPPPPERSLTLGETFPFGRWRVCLTDQPGPGGLPVEKIRCGPAPFVRGRRPGDRLTFPYGTKPLKKWLIEKKVPRDLRDGLPILVGADGLLAAGNLWSAPIPLESPHELLYFFCWRNEI